MHQHSVKLTGAGPYQTTAVLREESAAWKGSVDVPKELANGRQDGGALPLAVTDAYSIQVRKEAQAL